jgi:hypothetical protein
MFWASIAPACLQLNLGLVVACFDKSLQNLFEIVGVNAMIQCAIAIAAEAIPYKKFMLRVMLLGLQNPCHKLYYRFHSWV